MTFSINVSSICYKIVVLLVLYGTYRVLRLYYNDWSSPLSDLPGPPSPSWIYGNFKEILAADNSVLHEKWIEEYGPVIAYRGIANLRRLFTVDQVALRHILNNSQIYQKPELARYALKRIIGEGVLVVEGDKHKQQRKIMNPAFGPAQIRDLTQIYMDKSLQLRDLWMAQVNNKGGEDRLDVLSWLSKMTLDVIGLAGFNYDFGNLKPNNESNELNEAFSVLFRANQRIPLFSVAQALIPLLRIFPGDRDKETKKARSIMFRLAHQLLKESKDAASEKAEKGAPQDLQSDARPRDLLSVLVRANVSEDVPASQRLSDEDVIAQIPTFIVAGHETTSTGVCWTLFALTQEPEVQRKLREELLTVSTDNPTMDELNALPYLDAVVRETMRVHAPVPSTVRIAVQDDLIPLEKPFTDRKGVKHDHIAIRKGQTVFVPILAINRSKELWGEDAQEFRPERWEDPPKKAAAIPGIWGNMMTFLGGPHACIGYRFTLVEMKALLFTLVRAFEFELAVPAKDLIKRSAVVQRPVVVTDPTCNQMPLILRPYKED